MLTDAIHEVPYIEEPVEVGRGGFATVHRAKDLQAGRPVAVKLLSLRAQDGDLRYFDRERESLARLSTHPNVVTLHRTGVTTGGVPYLVMEYASGGSLADRLKADGPFSCAEAVGWVLPICSALQHAHEQGIRHRDIKPQNILISAHGEPLLSDFGIAGLSAGTETITGRAKLSLSYASPEQIEGRELDDSTDVYSLGATLYTLIAGTPAFADSNGAGLLHTAKRILEQRAPELDDSVPVALRNAIAAAMAKNPAYRPTVDEFRRALIGESSLDAPPPGDELPDITLEPDWDAAPAGEAILASAVDDWSTTIPRPEDAEPEDQGPLAALSGRPGRSLSLAALALLLLTGLAAAAWTSRGDDSAQLADRAGEQAQDATLGPLASEADGSGAARSEGEVLSAAQTSTTLNPSTEPSTTLTPTTEPSTIVAPTTIPDRDADGVLDSEDNCPDVGNRDQTNNDGDASGDECDPDDDNDGVPDVLDNCRIEANQSQADVDIDQIGDACDDFPDRDGDGIVDTNDSCVEQPDDQDSDGDGVPDKCDATPRGMNVVAARVRIDRVTLLSDENDDADLFGDLTVNGTKFGLPEISDNGDVRPGNWLSDRVAVEAGSPLVRVTLYVRDEAGFCLLCRDGKVDLSPEPGMNALHLVVDTESGAVDVAGRNWNRIENVGTLTGTADGDLSGTITQVGDDESGDDRVIQGSVDLTITLAREPAT